MRTLEKGRDKIKMLSDVLKRETLEPAEQERDRLLKEARAEAEVIIAEAKQKAEELEAAARARIKKERGVFHSSLNQACKQSLEALRQAIQQQLFSKELASEVAAASAGTQVIVSLVNAIVKAIEAEGIDSDLSVVLPKTVDPREVNRSLLAEVLERVGDKGIVLDNFKGGVRIAVLDKQLTLDISDAALSELFAQYLRKDFRRMLFEGSSTA